MSRGRGSTTSRRDARPFVNAEAPGGQVDLPGRVYKRRDELSVVHRRGERAVLRLVVRTVAAGSERHRFSPGSDCCAAALAHALGGGSLGGDSQMFVSRILSGPTGRLTVRDGLGDDGGHDWPSFRAPRRACPRRSRSWRVREFEHLPDLANDDLHHRRLRNRCRDRQAEVPRRHEEDPELERSVDRGTGLQSDHHEQREREHRARQGKAGLPHCGSEDPGRVGQAGRPGAVQQDHGAIAPTRAARPLQSPPLAGSARGRPRSRAGSIGLNSRTPRKRAPTPRLASVPHSPPVVRGIERTWRREADIPVAPLQLVASTSGAAPALSPTEFLLRRFCLASWWHRAQAGARVRAAPRTARRWWTRRSAQTPRRRTTVPAASWFRATSSSDVGAIAGACFGSAAGPPGATWRSCMPAAGTRFTQSPKLLTGPRPGRQAKEEDRG
jgi:hypothetical protein